MRVVRIAMTCLVISLLLVACKQEPGETTSTETRADGTTVATVEGWGVRFSLEMTTTTVARGERLPVRIVLRNVSDELIEKDDVDLRVFFDRDVNGPSLGGTGYSDSYGAAAHPMVLRSGETTTMDWWATADWGPPGTAPPDEVFVRAYYQAMFTPYIRVDIE